MSEIKSLLLKPCLRIDEAAILLDVTPRTIHRYLDEGKLTPVLDPAGRKRVRTDDVKRYL
jgi:excisionase family DNA binding protein